MNEEHKDVGVRRSLTNVGGGVDLETGSPELAKANVVYLAHALDVAPAGRDDNEPERSHVHGFHTYPARLHPTTAAHLVRALVKPDETVWDPFCGSGTTLVCALEAGRQALGSDLNPLAIMLTNAKIRMRSPEEIDALEAAGKRARAFADDRRKKRARATRRYGDEDMRAFAIHVLMELDSLRLFATTDPDLKPNARNDLMLVLSAMLVKVSQMRADTSQERVEKRHYPGFAARFFEDKTRELAERLRAFQLLRGKGSARAAICSATESPPWKGRSVNAIITSPPYAGTYDYVDHHALRLRWLGLGEHSFASKELGSRRKYSNLEGDQDATRLYHDEIARCLASWSRVLVPGARIALVVADSAGARFAVRADAVIRRAAETVPGYRFEARASQDRPHFHAASQDAFSDKPRREHVIVLAFEPQSSFVPPLRSGQARNMVEPSPPPRRAPREGAQLTRGVRRVGAAAARAAIPARAPAPARTPDARPSRPKPR